MTEETNRSAIEIMRDEMIAIENMELNNRNAERQTKLDDLGSQMALISQEVKRIVEMQAAILKESEDDIAKNNKKVLRVINRCEVAMGRPVLTLADAMQKFSPVAAAAEAQGASAEIEGLAPVETPAASEAPAAAPASDTETPPEGGATEAESGN